jgi:hypothetical protein
MAKAGMLSSRRVVPATACLILAALSLAATAQEPKEITVEGRVVCAGSGSVVPPDEGGCPPSFRLALQTDQGKTYLFLEGDSRAEIFDDPRVRQKRLRIRGWQKGVDEIEIVKLQSIKDGQLNDLYYRCETCNITAYAGGPCPCCRDELEFHETPSLPE